MVRSRRKPMIDVRPLRVRSPPLPTAELDALVMSKLSESAVPLSAYDIAAQLREGGRHVGMPTVYRALYRLSAAAVIERVEMLSAYRISEGRKTVRLVCVVCRKTAALAVPTLHDALVGAASDAGFCPQKVAFEIAGTCADCLADTDA